ncbi:terminase small subunit [Pseudomonas vancouverensis]|uniref:Terminase small subunit n=1 Tax=Pseudomonas vancouverensis TaxID=95300 RepID=A0A1H2MY20_PSEVA|nr:terminase small subunit [Pseudomonas vancouverensis]KAB0489650.1 terminase small subunit [Pseudomonas vancouverensis]TDB69296.1 terminase small subunit [Pseudomonas vancouverensis]SDU97416.1 phage terminase small subunit [Pseudomonas vancouverensis]
MALTDKKRRFADALQSGASKKDAAIAAGYSEKTAPQAGSRLAKDPDVIAAISRKTRAKNATPAEVKAAGKVNSPRDVETPESGLDLAEFDDPRDFLKAVMNQQEVEPRLRVDAAKALMPYIHGKVADQGKKEAVADAAKQAGKGRYAQGKPPLSIVKG